MARINPSTLVAAIEIADRINYVKTDPPVVKAARDFASDVSQATRAGRALISEGLASWQRSEGRGDAPSSTFQPA